MAERDPSIDYEITSEHFGVVLKELREGRNISQYALALSVYVDPSYVNRLENGGRKRPSPKVIDKIAEMLNLGYEEWSRLRRSAGYSGLDEKSLQTEPEVKAVLELLQSDDTPEATKDSIRQVLRYIAEFGKTAVEATFISEQE